jgi:hypothetical protein
LVEDTVGHLFLEFSIPRMGKRADALLLRGGTLFVIEFKVGSDAFDRHAIDQVHDYALDLKNFHLGSHDLPIVPVLVATRAEPGLLDVRWAPDRVAEPVLVGGVLVACVLPWRSRARRTALRLMLMSWPGVRPGIVQLPRSSKRRRRSTVPGPRNTTMEPSTICGDVVWLNFERRAAPAQRIGSGGRLQPLQCGGF